MGSDGGATAKPPCVGGCCPSVAVGSLRGFAAGEADPVGVGLVTAGVLLLALKR